MKDFSVKTWVGLVALVLFFLAGMYMLDRVTEVRQEQKELMQNHKELMRQTDRLLRKPLR